MTEPKISATMMAEPERESSAKGSPAITPGGDSSLSVEERTKRNWGVFCHLAALLGLLLNGASFLISAWVPLGIVGPLILWLMKKNEVPAVAYHGREAVNFQITMAGLQFVCSLLIPLLVGIPLTVAVMAFNFVVVVIAAVKTSNGEDYRYPFSLRLLN